MEKSHAPLDPEAARAYAEALRELNARLAASDAAHGDEYASGVIDPTDVFNAESIADSADALDAAADSADAEIEDAREGLDDGSAPTPTSTFPVSAPIRETGGRDLTDRMLRD